MSTFSHINSVRLDGLLNSIAKDCHLYKPLLSKHENEILASSNADAKAQLLFKTIVNWQSSLNEARISPNSQNVILENARTYASLTDSQNAVNKFKRKFNKLFLDGLSDSDKHKLAEKLTERFNKPCTKKYLDFSIFVIENFGYDENCFRFFSQYMGHQLVFPAKTTKEILNLAYFDPDEPDLPLQFTMAVASVAARAPLSSNDWNYPSQENSPFTQYSIPMWYVVKERREEAEVKNRAILYKSISRSFWSQKLKFSNFKTVMTLAKLQNGELIQNCTERSTQLFYNLTRKRTFDTIAYCSIQSKEEADEDESQEGCDHIFISAESADDPRRFHLDAWNGAKLYPADKHELYLQDYIATEDDDGSAITELFNPKTQYINAETFNIYPLDAFEHDSFSKHPGLIQLLKEFHEISTVDRESKMLKALQIITFIENKMPLFEIYDGAVHDLYDQMMYLTAKERKKGLQYTPNESERLCPINQALKDLDKTALKKLVSGKKERIKMTSSTILHAIKAAMISEDMEFYEMVAKIKPPILPLPIFIRFDKSPSIGLEKLTEEMFKDFPY
jgi:hypothetical protein